MGKQAGFAASVRSAVTQQALGWSWVESHRDPGKQYTDLTFQLRAEEPHPRFSIAITFSTGSYDSPTFEVLYGLFHESAWGRSRLGILGASKERDDPKYQVDGEHVFSVDNREAWLARHLVPVDSEARDLLAKSISAFAAHESFADRLPVLFDAWRTQRAPSLRDFGNYVRSLPETQAQPPTELFLHSRFPQPERALQEARYASFRDFIARKETLQSRCQEEFLRSFWYSERAAEPWLRPVKRCAACGKKERGAKKAEQSSSFGGYLDYICASCMPNEGI